MASVVFVQVRSTTDQISFEKSWEYVNDVFPCFVDLEKAYDGVPRDELWRVLQEYGINWHLLMAIKSFNCQPEVCVFLLIPNLHELNGQAQPKR